MKKISILALDNAISSSVMGSMDIFCQAGLTWNYFFGKDPASYFEVEIVTQDGKPVTCLNKVKIYPHRAAAEVKSTDVIIISSFSDFETLTTNKGIIDWLKEHHNNGTTIASICVGSFLLAETGLLDGKIATTHWGFAGEFKQRYPLIELRPERLITDEGKLLCSGACSSYIDLSMYLIERQHDVVENRQVRDQVELLEDKTELSPAHLCEDLFGKLGHVAAVDHDAAGGRARHAPDQAQEGRLAGAARALEGHHLSPRHRHRHPVDRTHLVGPPRVVDLGGVFGEDQGKVRGVHDRITSSGSAIAAFHDGKIVLAT